MKITRSFFALGASLGCAATLAAGDACADFRQLIKSTYNFKPPRLTPAEREAKSAAMDAVWSAAKANEAKLLPCLREALRDQQADGFFLFDGSNLLVSLDPSAGSKSLQVRAYAQVDLADVDLEVWLTTLAQLGLGGLDATAAAERWLATPGVKYYLPEHGVHEVDQFEGALFLYGSMDEAFAVPALNRIARQPNHPGREIAFTRLLESATPEASRLVREIDLAKFSPKVREAAKNFLGRKNFFEPRTRPKTSRKEFVDAFERLVQGDRESFDQLVAAVPDGERDIVTVMQPEDLPLLRRVRRTVIATCNPHQVDFYYSFTGIIQTLENKFVPAAPAAGKP